MQRARDAASDLSAALLRLAEAEDALRAISAGEVDGFVVSDGAGGQRVFTLSTADRPYRRFVENMRDGAATVSPGGIILYANRRLAQLLSCAPQKIVGSPLSTFLAAERQLGLAEIRGPDGLGATIELDLRDAHGVAIPVQVGGSPLLIDGEILTCLTFSDLSAHKAKDREIARLGEAQAGRMAELQHAQATLTRQATHDALTGLPNRALLTDRIDRALAYSKRSGRCTAVIFVDLDRFKQVNDTRGHAAGDFVLQQVAGVLVAALRSIDTVARIGGDEFVVLTPDIDSQVAAVDLGARLLCELAARARGIDDIEHVDASIGVAVSIGGRGTAETLLSEADTAMYQAKSLGGGRLAVFDTELGRQVHDRSIARRGLESALDDHRVIAHYQPIVELPDEVVTGFEALARIVEHDGSITPPGAFIPAAEESRLIAPLGAHVLGVAFRDARSWQLAGLTQRRLTVAVNVSSRQFEVGDFTAVVRERLEATGLDPGDVHLELTETAIIDLRPELLQQLASLTDLGVQIGLDDFGTGYASLTHLRRLPLDFVKIDQTFVQGLGVDREDERIVAAVIDLAANLGLRSIAEGVETSDQLDRLRELGCDQAQGYLFARPMAADAVAASTRRSAR
jgi:diguanylate cyclase (GGDEF)-like protein/PAS domain S-box-containing protein